MGSAKDGSEAVAITQTFWSSWILVGCSTVSFPTFSRFKA